MSILGAVINHLISQNIAGGQVYAGHAPQSAKTPYVVLAKTSGSRGMSLDGNDDGLEPVTFDATCYGLTYKEAAETAEPTSNALHAFRGRMGAGSTAKDIRHMRQTSYSEGTQRRPGQASDEWMHRITLGFDTWHSDG